MAGDQRVRGFLWVRHLCPLATSGLDVRILRQHPHRSWIEREDAPSLDGVAAYVVVGFLAMAESGLFVGVLVPGETAMILGGVLVSQGHAELGWMVVGALAGAVAGDSISYEIAAGSSGPARGRR